MLCARRHHDRHDRHVLRSHLPGVIIFLCVLAAAAFAQEWSFEYVACPRQFDDMTDRTIQVDAAGHRHVAFGGFNLHYMWEDGSTWHEDIADPTPHVGSYASLDLDSEGRPHVAYHDAQNGDLRYAWKGPGGWEAEVVDSVGWVGQWTSVAVDGSGVPHIAYYDTTAHDLKYARRMPLGWWIETVESAGAVGEYASMAVDASGNAQIAYFARTDGIFGTLKHAGWNGTHWVTTEVAAVNGAKVSIDLDADGHAQVSFCAGGVVGHAFWDGVEWQVESLPLHHAYSSSITVDEGGTIHIVSMEFLYMGDREYRIWYSYNDGTGWHPVVVFSSIDYPMYRSPSLAVALDGTRHIATAGFVGGVDLLYCASGLPGAWQRETVANETSLGGCSLVVDEADHPHVSWGSGFAGGSLHYGQRDEWGWHTTTVDSAGAFTSLVLNPSGYPHVSYSAFRDYSNRDLRYAHLHATGWQIETADNWTRCGHTSLALDSSGSPHISYHDAGDNDLLCASKGAAGWHVQSIDSPGHVGYHNSLALDSSGFAHIAYRDGTNADLRYAHEDASTWYLQVVDSQGDPRLTPSLVLDDLDYPHVSYGGYTSLRYAYRDTAGWHVEIVDVEGSSGTSLELDGAGRAHISYRCGTELRYAREDATGWHVQTVAAVAALEDVGECTSLALDALGWAHICYIDDGALKYARMVSPPAGAGPALPLRVIAVDIWPNPARAAFHARLAGPEGQGAVRLTVVDLLGRRVTSLQQPQAMGPGGTMTLRLPDFLPAGQYFLGVEGESSRQFVPITVVK